jgi:hypothetical protein
MKTKAFCPNCGSENEGFPGGRVTCRACTASFEVPRAAGAAPPEPPPPSVVKPPPVFGGPPPQSPHVPSGYVGPPPAGFGGLSSAGVGGQKNQLAVVSLVLGIVCCIPFGSIGALVTGFMAIKQIDESGGAQGGRELAIAGMVLGGLSLALSMVSIVVNLLAR